MANGIPHRDCLRCKSISELLCLLAFAFVSEARIDLISVWLAPLTREVSYKGKIFEGAEKSKKGQNVRSSIPNGRSKEPHNRYKRASVAFTLGSAMTIGKS